METKMYKQNGNKKSINKPALYEMKMRQ